MIYDRLLYKIINKTVVLIIDSKNDNIIRPFVFFILNIFFFIPPLILSYLNEVFIYYFRIILDLVL